MKRVLCTAVVCIMLLTLFVVPVSADIGVNLSYSAAEKTLKIYGEASGYILITMPPSGVKPEEISEINPPIIAKQIFSAGSYEITFTVPENMPGGKYEVYVSSGKETKSAKFFHINSDSDAIVLLNGAKDIEEFTKVIDEYEADLGIDAEDEVYIEGKEKIIGLIYALKEEYETVFDFSDAYSMAYALYSLGDADTKQASEILKKYERVLGIDFSKYENATEKVKDKVSKMLSEANFSEILSEDVTFSMFFEKLIPYSAVLCCDTWYDLKSVITDTYKDDFSALVDNTSYKKIKEKDKVYKEMMKKNFDSLNDVYDAFEEVTEKVLKSEKKTESTPSGSGGSSSSGGMGASIGPATVTIAPKNEEKNAFVDLGKEHWSYNAVEKMADMGVISGYSDGSFQPDKFITRAEFTKLANEICKRLLKGKEKDLVKIATLGDSLTQGLFGDDGKYTTQLSYSTYLQEYLGDGFEVKNFGRSSHGLYEKHQYYYRNTEQYKDALKYDADIVLIIFGSNDMKTEYWNDIKSDYNNIYREFINEFINLKSKPMVLIGLPTPVYGDGDMAKDRPMKNRLEIIEVEKKVAEDLGITVVDTFSLMEGKENLFPDGVHFNIEGGKTVAGAFKNAIFDMYGKNTTNIKFEDVKNGDWFESIVKEVAGKGIVNGSNGNFLPNNNITREDATLIMYRIVSKVKMISGRKSFADSNTFSEYAKLAIEKMAAADLVSGVGGQNFAPRENLTRAQAAQIMYNVLN